MTLWTPEKGSSLFTEAPDQSSVDVSHNTIYNNRFWLTTRDDTEAPKLLSLLRNSLFQYIQGPSFSLTDLNILQLNYVFGTLVE